MATTLEAPASPVVSDTMGGLRGPNSTSAMSDVPWSTGYAEEGIAGITRSVAIIFALYGLAATFLLGALLGANFHVFQLPGLRGAAVGSAGSAPAAITLDVTAAEFKLTPATLHLDRPGQLTVSLKNTGVIEHDFAVEGVAGTVDAKPGASGSGVFKLPKAGTYTYYCTLPGHREAGMQGTLTVG